MADIRRQSLPALAAILLLGHLSYSCTFVITPAMLLLESCDHLGIPHADCPENAVAQAAMTHTAVLWSMLNSVPPVFVSALLAHLSDVWGRKPMLLLWAFGSLLVNGAIALQGAANRWTWLQVGTLNMLGGIYTSTGIIFASVADLTDDWERARYLGYVEVALWLGELLGPMVSGQVSLRFGPQRAFYIPASLSAVSCLVIGIMYRETLAMESRASFKVHQAHPIGVISMMCRVPRCIAYVVGLFLAQWSIVMGMNLWPMFCKLEFAWTDAGVGALDSVFLAANAIGLFCLLPGMSKHFSQRHVLVTSAALGAVMWLFHAVATDGWQLFALTAFAVATAMMFPVVRSRMCTELGAHNYGTALGILGLAQQVIILGAVPAANVVWRWTLDNGLPNRTPFVITAAVYLSAMLVFIFIPFESPRRSAHNVCTTVFLDAEVCPEDERPAALLPRAGLHR